MAKSIDCAGLEGWWAADNEASAEHQVSQLVGAFVWALQPELVIESGCGDGQTSECIGVALRSNGHGRLVAVDIDGAKRNATASRCVGLPVIVLHTDGRRWSPKTAVDLAWVDSGDPADRLADLDCLLPCLSPQAVVLVHDTGTQFGLRVPLIAWAEAHGFDLVLLPTPRGVGILRNRASRLTYIV